MGRWGGGLPGPRRALAGNNPGPRLALLKGPGRTDPGEEPRRRRPPVSSFDKNPELLKGYQAAHPIGDPTLGVVFGTAASTVMNKILDKACEDKDLTPEGGVKQGQGGHRRDRHRGFCCAADVEVGKSPSLKSYIFAPAKVPGGAKLLTGLDEGEDAAGFTPGG